nr:potassium transporter TrkG [uncultured Dethiosulfovibrio sp.]
MILIGTLLLWGFNRLEGMDLSLLDAFFTSTSAVCVTGLAVVDTGADLAVPSQVVLLLLIQLGGLGVMTATTFMFMLLRMRIGIRQRILFAGGMGLDGPSGAVRLVLRIVKITFLIEFAMAIPLFLGFLDRFDWRSSLWYSVFHSISAFCNAGFSPFSDSLGSFTFNWLILGAVMVLIVLGGAGFVILGDLWEWIIGGKRKLSVHCKLVLLTTFWLIIIGTCFFLIMEWNGALAGMSPSLKLWNALFCAITPRTAGFNTISMGSLSVHSAFMVMILMIIGASPGSTGGGIKTTTFSLLVSSVFFNTRGSSRLVLWHRTVPQETVLKAMMLFFLYLMAIVLGVFALSTVENLSFEAVVFEVVSALGTVGLSMGITANLSWAGKILLIILMFWGRIGVMTFMFSLVEKDDCDKIGYVEVSVPIG